MLKRRTRAETRRRGTYLRSSGAGAAEGPGATATGGGCARAPRRPSGSRCARGQAFVLAAKCRTSRRSDRVLNGERRDLLLLAAGTRAYVGVIALGAAARHGMRRRNGRKLARHVRCRFAITYRRGGRVGARRRACRCSPPVVWTCRARRHVAFHHHRQSLSFPFLPFR